MIAFMAIVMLIGVVVNNAILLLDSADQRAKRTDEQTFRHPHRGQGKVPGHHARDIRFHRGACPARLRYRR